MPIPILVLALSPPPELVMAAAVEEAGFDDCVEVVFEAARGLEVVVVVEVEVVVVVMTADTEAKEVELENKVEGRGVSPSIFQILNE